MDIKFHPEHCWVKVEGEQGTIGISDYAQSQLGKIIQGVGNMAVIWRSWFRFQN